MTTAPPAPPVMVVEVTPLDARRMMVLVISVSVVGVPAPPAGIEIATDDPGEIEPDPTFVTME